MKAIKYSIMAVAVGLGMAACTDLDEKVYDRIDSSVYYQNEASVQGAVAAIYKQTGATLGGENFFFLSEFSAGSNGALILRLLKELGLKHGRVLAWPTCCSATWRN